MRSRGPLALLYKRDTFDLYPPPPLPPLLRIPVQILTVEAAGTDFPLPSVKNLKKLVPLLYSIPPPALTDPPILPLKLNDLPSKPFPSTLALPIDGVDGVDDSLTGPLIIVESKISIDRARPPLENRGEERSEGSGKEQGKGRGRDQGRDSRSRVRIPIAEEFQSRNRGEGRRKEARRETRRNR